MSVRAKVRKSYIINGQICTVVDVEPAVPQIGLPAQVLVRYNDMSTQRFMRAFFNANARPFA